MLQLTQIFLNKWLSKPDTLVNRPTREPVLAAHNIR